MQFMSFHDFILYMIIVDTTHLQKCYGHEIAASTVSVLFHLAITFLKKQIRLIVLSLSGVLDARKTHTVVVKN